MFPFKIKFFYKMGNEISKDQIENALNTVQKTLYEKGVNDIVKEGNYLEFKKSFFTPGSNWHILAFVDSGTFRIHKNDLNKVTKIEYRVTFITFWILSIIFSIIVFAASGNILFSLWAFLLAGPVSWSILLLRHYLFFRSLKKVVLQQKTNIDHQKIIEGNDK